jgi:hypothetical protein
MRTPLYVFGGLPTDLDVPHEPLVRSHVHGRNSRPRGHFGRFVQREEDASVFHGSHRTRPDTQPMLHFLNCRSYTYTFAATTQHAIEHGMSAQIRKVITMQIFNH